MNKLHGRMVRVLILAACILLAACRPEVRAVSLHIGDSLMEEAVSQIQFQETARDEAVLSVFNAMGGSSLKDNDYWIPRLANIQEHVSLDIVFISLGSNDAYLGEDLPAPDVLSTQIDELLASFAPGTIVSWILPPSHIAIKWNVPVELSVVTQAIINARDSGNWPNLRVLDFDLWISHRGKDIGMLLAADEVHLNHTGYGQWAHMIAKAIDTEFPVK